MSSVSEPVEPGLLVVAGVETLADADPSAGWLDSVQRRTMDVRVILQAKVWVDTRGVAHRVTEINFDHRANVVEMLLDQEGDLTIAAAAGVTAAHAFGFIDQGEAVRRLQSLDALGPGWMARTPLVRRLRELNDIPWPGLSAPPGTVPQPPQAEACPGELVDGAGGLWRVSTETSIYLLDLDRREVLRMGGAARGHHVAANGEVVWAFQFDSDYQWHRLLQLEQCRIGAPMRAVQALAGRESSIRSTFVTEIRPAVPP